MGNIKHEMMKKKGTRCPYLIEAIARLFICVCCIPVFLSCRPETNAVSKILLGTVVTITVDGDRGRSSDAIISAFAEIERIENLFSIYKPGSDISAVNTGAFKKPVRTDKEILDLIKLSLEVSEKTGGAFDITFASMGKIWNFGSDEFIPPPADAIKRVMPAFSYRNVKIDDRGNTIRFMHAGTKIGLGGIAKGYAVRRAVNVLREKNIRNAIVACAGDIQVLGARNGRPWLAGIKHPRENSIIGSIKLYDGDCVSTSGDYERFKFYNGKRYHHIINPATGYPAESGLISVTILGSDPVLVDAYSTAFFIMGLPKIQKFLTDRSDLATVLITGDLKIYVSEKLRNRVEFLPGYMVSYF